MHLKVVGDYPNQKQRDIVPKKQGQSGVLRRK
jgi:hypothetical protein